VCILEGDQVAGLSGCGRLLWPLEYHFPPGIAAQPWMVLRCASVNGSGASSATYSYKEERLDPSWTCDAAVC